MRSYIIFLCLPLLASCSWGGGSSSSSSGSGASPNDQLTEYIYTKYKNPHRFCDSHSTGSAQTTILSIINQKEIFWKSVFLKFLPLFLSGPQIFLRKF